MPPEPSVVSVTERCAAFLQLPGSWFLNNAGWVIGENRTLLVDTCATEERSRLLLGAVAEADRSGAPPTAVLTHAHGDHAHGAGLVARAGGEVLVTPAAAADISAGPNTYPAIFSFSGWGDIAPPRTTKPVMEPIELDLGGISAHVIPVPGTAHTGGDLVVWVPSEGVIFSGDLIFSGVTPLAISGSVYGWLEALNWLEGLGATSLIPGHGPVSTRPSEPIGEVRAYLEWLVSVVGEAGVPDFEVLEQKAWKRFGGWLDAERNAVNLRVAHAEVSGQSCSFASAIEAMRASAGGMIALDIGL